MHTFIDETKARGYVVVAATAAPERLKVATKELATLLMPGQRSVHMKSEGAPRRRLIADSIASLRGELGIRVVVYDAGRRGPERDRRTRCLHALVKDAGMRLGANRLVFDLDLTLQSWDRQKLIEFTPAAGFGDRVEYVHRARHEEPLLAIPDAVAWCYARRDGWRQRIDPLIADVRPL